MKDSGDGMYYKGHGEIGITFNNNLKNDGISQYWSQYWVNIGVNIGVNMESIWCQIKWIQTLNLDWQ